MPTGAQAVRQGQSPLQYAATDAAVERVNLTLPVLSLARPQGFRRGLVEHADDAGRGYAQWRAAACHPGAAGASVGLITSMTWPC